MIRAVFFDSAFLPANRYLFGDHPEIDIGGAKGAGVDACLEANALLESPERCAAD
jgi:FMN phosphatase YigB (HAD superfamily)